MSYVSSYGITPEETWLHVEAVKNKALGTVNNKD
jgi:hypothetical protein